MTATRERSRSDPNHFPMHKPGDCPPVPSMRHHRRSVDRVWPPALEVRLARLSMDEGISLGPHIIPPLPPVAYQVMYSPPEQDRNIISTESRLEPIQEGIVGTGVGDTAETSTVEARAAAGSVASVSGSTAPPAYCLPSGGHRYSQAQASHEHSRTQAHTGGSYSSGSSASTISDKRRNSILGPLSPSMTFQMDRPLWQQHHTHPPQIDVQYRKRCKSISYGGHDCGGTRGVAGGGNVIGLGRHYMALHANSFDGSNRGNDCNLNVGLNLNGSSDNSRGGNHNLNSRTTRHMSIFSPSNQSPGSFFAGGRPMNRMSMISMDEIPSEFGEDLFHPDRRGTGGRRDSNNSDSSMNSITGMAFMDSPVSQFQERLEHLATTEPYPRLSMPQPGHHASYSYRRTVELDQNDFQDKDDHNQYDGEKGHDRESRENQESSRSGRDRDEDDKVMQDVRHNEGGSSSLLDLPVLYYSDSRPSISPTRKNPLSAETSRASSRMSSRSRSPLGRVSMAASRSPLQEINYNVQADLPTSRALQRQADQQPPRTGSGGSGNSKRLPMMSGSPLQGRYISTMDNQENSIDSPSSSPAFLDINIPNDQDRWRSPTLSAIASKSTSRGPSPLRLRSISPGGLSTGTAIAMAMSTPRFRGKNSQQQRQLRQGIQTLDAEEGDGNERDMSVDIPLIEAHDEISLQDIWRMEDEERKDRIYGEGDSTAVSHKDGKVVLAESAGLVEGHAGHMKGEQHAHEEARLIQELLHRGAQDFVH